MKRPLQAAAANPQPQRADASRRRFAAALGLLPLASWAQSAPRTQLPAAVALADELASALAKKQPLLVMASLDGCIYCHMARQQHLLPMAARGQAIVQVDWRSDRVLRDFTGATVTHHQMIERWGLTIAPTLLFFGPGGREVAERMVGGYLPDFYGAYLDGRLDTARSQIAR